MLKDGVYITKKRDIATDLTFTPAVHSKSREEEEHVEERLIKAGEEYRERKKLMQIDQELKAREEENRIMQINKNVTDYKQPHNLR